MSINAPTYTVDYYERYLRSFAVREKIIPTKDKAKYIDFITKTVVFHGGLIGPLAKASLYFSNNVNVICSDKSAKERIETTLENLGVFTVQTTFWLTAMMFDYVCVLYLPHQLLKMNCPSCNDRFVINRDSYDYPFMITTLDYEQDNTIKVRHSGNISEHEKRNHPREYGIKCTCPHCNTEFTDTPDTEWDFTRSGSLRVVNPKLLVVDTNDVGKQRAIIDPKHYNGPLALDREIEWFHLDGVPWKLATTYATKDTTYTPDESIYFLYSMREIASLGTAGEGVAPIISSISDTIGMDVFKMGNEGLAFSKIDPLYMVSPINPSSPTYEGMSHGEFTDFVVQGMKAHQEGDINRVLVSPMPVDTNALFGDGKRFMHIQELVTYNNFILGSLGLSSDALHGTSGFSSDPIMLDSWNKLIKHFANKFIKLLDRVLNLTSERYRLANARTDKRDRITLWLPQLSQLQGGMNLSEKWGLVHQGKLPFSVFTKDLGLPNEEVWRGELMEDEIEKARFEINKEREMTLMHERELEKDMSKDQGTGGQNRALANHAIIQEAEQLAMHLFETDPRTRSSQLRLLAKEDYVLHAVVRNKIEDLRNQYMIQRQEETGEPM